MANQSEPKRFKEKKSWIYVLWHQNMTISNESIGFINKIKLENNCAQIQKLQNGSPDETSLKTLWIDYWKIMCDLESS